MYFKILSFIICEDQTGCFEELVGDFMPSIITKFPAFSSDLQIEIMNFVSFVYLNFSNTKLAGIRDKLRNNGILSKLEPS